MTVSITDGGLETALTSRLGQVLPHFAAFVLLDSEQGRESLREYYRPFLEIASSSGLPLVLDTPTWRANPDWAKALGYDVDGLDHVNFAAVRLTRECVSEFGTSAAVTVSGSVGPRSEEYAPERRMRPSEAKAYHGPQIRALADSGVDRIAAVTMLDAGEATGIVQAAQMHQVPVVVSFTVGADGRIPSGESLGDVIRAVDDQTSRSAMGYFVNCAHPNEAARAIRLGGMEIDRLIGFRLNAAEHSEAGAGDDPEVFAAGVYELRGLAPYAQVFGGCCGTDWPHISALAEALRR